VALAISIDACSNLCRTARAIAPARLDPAEALMFFESWASLIATAITGVSAYVALIAMVRLSGKRTLAKMNAFDLIVTVALGSTLSTILVSRETPLADGVLALGLLVGLQFAVAWSSVRWRSFERVVKSEPTLLVFRGEIRSADLRRQRVSREELRAAVRGAGLPDISDAGAVVLETNGAFSVVPSQALSTRPS
jgi:uncharacterized membrane protein YcaP (DUF421 family)